MAPVSDELRGGTSVPDRERLAQNELFRGLSPATMEAAIEIPELVTIGPGETLFEENETPDCVYLIVEGAVRISKCGRGGQQETLAELGDGDFFGDMALYDAGARSARASTTAPTRLGRVDRNGLSNLVHLAPLELTENLTREGIRRLRQANDHFIQQVLEAERLSIVGSVAAGMAHDLKNSIGIIRNATFLLEDPLPPSEVVRWTSMIRRNGELMFDMVQELLDFSKGQVEPRPERVTVEQIVADLDEQVLAALPKRGISVEKDVTFAGTVVVDWHRFLRVLLNIIKNATDAMPNGGELRLSIRDPGDAVVFGVADTGTGIPADVLPRIFDVFMTHGKPNGTGLGLAMAKSVVEAHGGTIRVESIVGEGSYFEIEIPQVPAD